MSHAAINRSGQKHKRRPGIRQHLSCLACLAIIVMGGQSPASVHAAKTTAVQSGPQRVLSAPQKASLSHEAHTRSTAATIALFQKMPLSIEKNVGQFPSSFGFVAQGPGYTFAFAKTGVNIVLATPHQKQTSMAFHMSVLGNNKNPEVSGATRLPGNVDYFIGGPQSGGWHTDIPTYASVVYKDIYPGINLSYHGTQGQLEYDFSLAPHSNPRLIRLAFGRTSALRLGSAGQLLVTVNGMTLTQAKPVVYQWIGTKRISVAGEFTLINAHTVGFSLGHYDATRPLVIDPTVVYSTYFAGNNAQPVAIAVDPSGNVFIGGQAGAALPIVAPFKIANPGGTAFIAKINAQGSAILYSSFLGGTGGTTNLTSLTTDAQGNLYMAGSTNATTFPTTRRALQLIKAGGLDAFITKLSADGTQLIYSTYVGGSTDNANTVGDDAAAGIAVDKYGDAFVAGYTYSYNFPLVHPYQGTLGLGKGTLGNQRDAFLLELNPEGSHLLYSTYFGGSGDDVATNVVVDSQGRATIAGTTNSPDFPITANAYQTTPSAAATTPYVCQFNAQGTALRFCTYLGMVTGDKIVGLAVDQHNNIYVGGQTTGGIIPTLGSGFVVPAGGIDIFVVKFDSAGILRYSTYLGGNGDDITTGIAVDRFGSVYVAGSTNSSTFTTPSFPLRNAFQADLGGNRGGFGMSDAFLAKLNSCGTDILYSTYMGGTFADTATGIAVDSASSAYIVGQTSSPNFPLRHPLDSGFVPSTDTFISKISSPLNPPVPSCPLPLTISLPTGQFNLSLPLTVTVHTEPFAHVSAGFDLIKAQVPQDIATNIGVERLRKQDLIAKYVFYHTTVTGMANALGVYRGVFHVLYHTSQIIPGLVNVSARTPVQRVFASYPIVVYPVAGS